ncbi:MAG: RICIN domain-containing protein [Terracidiphilus sp.]|jgi:arabinan endo-1,5-alpha-L-arabinosidase
MKRLLMCTAILATLPLIAHAQITMNYSVEYKIKNVNSGLVLGISGASQTAGANLVQWADNGTADHLWHFMPIGTNVYNIENMNSHQVIGVSGASKSDGAQIVQWADSGTTDHNWQVIKASDGNYLIKNVNSGLYLEVENAGTSDTATIDQWASTGCTCQEWTFTNTGTDPYPTPRSVSGTGKYVHDPDMIYDSTSGAYWLYGTHQTIAYSTDRTTFTLTTESSSKGACTAAEGGYWITDDSHCPIIGPDFTQWTGLQSPKSDNGGEDDDVWAPSVMYAGGKYYQAYSIPVEPDTVGGEAIIGMASATTPYGPWTQLGWEISSWSNTTNTPITSSYGWNFVKGTTYNAIDGAPFVDASGNWWMVFGSWFDGTHLFQLSTSTGLRSNSTMYSIAARGAGEEGPFIIYTNGYYYYFAPINACCSATSDYRTIYGRSSSVSGPYVDRGGLALTAGGGTILISTHDNVVGPGGGSVFIDSHNSNAVTFVYHYYDSNNSGTPTLGINTIKFTSDGWPYLTTN